MITNKELNEVTLSPTKKDYYQIWNELLELADKISARWSPTSTNESDPGIVLLKVLTAVADKLNYNIDKNTLEAFMPSATQVDSMRKLTEMMGYDMKHYQAATGKVTISYKASNDTPITQFIEGIYFPKFVNLKNEDEDINYITLEDFVLQTNIESREITVMEGELIECEANNDNIITSFHLDDANRYILPEYAIAENGIFITNIKDNTESNLWRREQNLNAQQLGSTIYKVGFDSSLQLPYVQFPEDIKTIIEDGIKIRYVRTTGLNGNIAAKVLSKFEKPAIWATTEESDPIRELSPDNFTVVNNSAFSNGADPESLNAAYNNYKKTTGTFDTLVTCRDYMNKIYQMTESDTDSTPLVSNIIVADIRDDINRSTPVCTFNEYGICYKDASLVNPITINLAEGSSYNTTQNKIEHFDLIFYPFKTVYGLNNKTEYKNSFKYTAENLEKIKADLALTKTIAHNIVTPTVGTDDNDIACIKNYLKLKAKITTTKKVTYGEEAEILNNIYKAIFTNFNARQIDFGEEIPYESIVSVIKNADYRIKDINLDEPSLNTKFCLINNSEEILSDNNNTSELGNRLYNKLAIRNVLAGKISAFEYNNDFISEYDKTIYSDDYKSYPNDEKKITSIVSHFDVGTAFANRDTDKESEGLILKENEVIQFRIPNFKTVKTYPAYVNYFIKLNTRTGNNGACPATMQPLNTYMSSSDRWVNFINDSTVVQQRLDIITSEIANENDFRTALKTKVALFIRSVDDQGKAIYALAEKYESDTDYYYLPINDNIFAAFNSWIKTQPGNHKDASGNTRCLEGIYKTTGVQEKPFGYLIDENLMKYLPAYKFGTVASNIEALNSFYVQVTHNDDISGSWTKDGLGRDADYEGVPKDGEYKLKEGEYLLINYTESKTDESGTERKSVINKTYEAGDIIRANFELIDSSLYKNNHSFSKLDGFSFSGKQPAGMFTLGANEQIEIRDIVKVSLDDSVTYLYWTLNSDDADSEVNQFIFNEKYNGVENSAYTLKEGEHLYYTNSKKQDLVDYGAGTLIVKKSNNTPNLYKYASFGEVSEEDIMTNGLAAAIPWQKYDLSTNKGLEIIENQYISLTEGDVLISVNGSVPSTDIGNDWITVAAGAEYRFAEEETSSSLPAVVIDDIKWSVRSRLDFNLSKTISQPLNWGDKFEVKLIDGQNNSSTETLQSDAETVGRKKILIPMHINLNYTYQAANDTLKIPQASLDTLDLKLKISKQESPKVSTTEDLTLNNYINGEAKYTKFNFANLPNTHDITTPAFTLNTYIPQNSFGLVLFYYIKDIDEEENSGAYIKVDASTDAKIEFFNCDDEENTLKRLKAGINIIKLNSDTTQLQIYSDEAKKSTIVFGNLDIINGINPKLDYRLTDPTIGAEDPQNAKLIQLLNDIKSLSIAKDFYYNIPIQSSSDIDLNAAIETDLLSSPLVWYDPNNINRKFVISEIDADYLTTGITLTKASRA